MPDTTTRPPHTHADPASRASVPAPLAVPTGAEVHVTLDARPGAWSVGAQYAPLDGWMFNGDVPGPVINARVGDTLVVRLTNHLAEPTSVHWHGIRLPAPMDGTEVTQPLVQPGESFEYRFVLPDAGTFWYHPHANEVVQLERGLYGALVVRGNDEPVVAGERILMFDDVRLDRRGRIATPGRSLEKHNRREGSVLLLNGRVQPTLTTPPGRVERWRLINVANARYVRFSLGGSAFRQIATDGGLMEFASEQTELLLAPGERADILVGPFAGGHVHHIQSLPYDRGLGARRLPDVFGTVRVAGEPETTTPAETSAATSGDAPRDSSSPVPTVLRRIAPLAPADATPTREVRLGGRMSVRHFVEFTVDGTRHSHSPPVLVGELQIWDIINETPIDHPYHLHGFFFQVLSVNGQPTAVRAWKDTVNVPRRGRVRIAWLPDDRPGAWMAHCHILEHHAAGMMQHLRVVGR